jgi:hypothetical protein
MSSTAAHPASPYAPATITAPAYNSGTLLYESTISTTVVSTYTVNVVGSNAGSGLSSVSSTLTFVVNSCGSPAVTMSNTISQAPLNVV